MRVKQDLIDYVDHHATIPFSHHKEVKNYMEEMKESLVPSFTEEDIVDVNTNTNLTFEQVEAAIKKREE
jgi:hypothetical protein